MSTLDLANYYANLLILQYVGQPRAFATVKAQATPVLMPQTTVQDITFSPVPDAGTFILAYGNSTTSPLNWDDSNTVIQTQLRLISELSAVVVTGSIASGTLTVTFDGTNPVAELLVVPLNELTASGDPIEITVTETDVILPLAVQDGFNLIGDNIAVGVQLDVIGEYVGVSRTGPGFYQQITLSDADFLTLIQFAIIRNNAGSSLAEIVGLLFQFFGSGITVTDYLDMFMSVTINESLGSTDVLQLVVTEGIFPIPMAVGYYIETVDDTNAFGFADSINSGGFGDLSDPDVGGKFASLFAP